MEKFRLIVSGNFNENKDTNNLDSLISLHPMGAAEFEGTALYDALSRILKNFKNYTFYDTEIIGANKQNLVVFTKNKQVPLKIRQFIKSPYELKRPTKLEKITIFDTTSENTNHIFRYSFWWCIDNSDKNSINYYSSIGDWIACYKNYSNLLFEGLKNEKNRVE